VNSPGTRTPVRPKASTRNLRRGTPQSPRVRLAWQGARSGGKLPGSLPSGAGRKEQAENPLPQSALSPRHRPRRGPSRLQPCLNIDALQRRTNRRRNERSGWYLLTNSPAQALLDERAQKTEMLSLEQDIIRRSELHVREDRGVRRRLVNGGSALLLAIAAMLAGCAFPSPPGRAAADMTALGI